MGQYTGADLISAGMDSKARTALNDAKLPVGERWRLAAPYWERARNTGYARAFAITLRDIYGAAELNEKTCERISEEITAANRPGLTQKILEQRCRIRFAVLDDYFHPAPVAPESAFYVPARRFDRFIALPSREALQKLEQALDTAITSLGDLEKALAADFERNLEVARMRVIKIGQAYLRPLHFGDPSRAEAERDFEELARGAAPAAPASRYEQLTRPAARNLQDYMLHRVLRLARDQRRGRPIPVQIHTGIHAGNRNYIPNSNPAQLINLFFEYPEITFDLFHSSYPYLSELAAIAKSFPNVFIDLTWIYIISPAAAARALDEYLDTVPANKILGFGGDYNYAEMVWGHSVMAREIIAGVLEKKVAAGEFGPRRALALCRRLLHDNAAELFQPAG
ncbi:MAG: hypothetical protein FJW37_15335 [Acidobacteria bacterium]|nr:hypothetical protein [Acidobacteriota bacterium]